MKIDDDPDKVLRTSTKFQSEQKVGLLPKEPNATYLNGFKKLVPSDEAVNGCRVEHNDLIDFAAQEHVFLSSQYTYTSLHIISQQVLSGESQSCFLGINLLFSWFIKCNPNPNSA